MYPPVFRHAQTIIFGGCGGIAYRSSIKQGFFRLIAYRSCHSNRIFRPTITEIGHMNQVNGIASPGAPKINKNVDFLRSTDLDSEFENVVGIFNRLFWGRGGCGNRVVAVTKTTNIDCPKRRYQCRN